jgi:S-formylglutathione hydrolase FrmB
MSLNRIENKSVFMKFIKKISLLIFLLLLLQHGRAAIVDTMEVSSVSMGKKIKAVVITPKAYSEISHRFPVIYLLHGLSDNYSKWVKEVPSIKDLADQYKLIIVCPDGDYGSWYLDSPIDKQSQYETFISKELPAFIDSKFRTIADREGRAITGLSMGGQGALYNAARNPGVFSCAGSMSGSVDFTTIAESGEPRDWANKEIAKRLGPYADNAALWRSSSAVFMTDQIKAAGLALVLDCGIDDFLIWNNRELHHRLLYEKVPHEYLERPGAHNWEYWANAIEYQMLFLSNHLKKAGK